MSMVARTNPGPAEDDITDTDDGDTRISAGAFWPDIVLRELRLAIRLPGRVTTSRLLHTATRALILERYRDADTTDKGDRRADALDIQTSDLWRDVSWAISDILRRPRIFAELC
ncbi:head completion/stabilization protein [Escherichia coli]